MKNCELCKVPARTFCESDEASLCWDCDAKVHGANFLVARHSRTLLCHACQSVTPWKASGAKLGNTFSLCESCSGGVRGSDEEGDESEGDNDDEIDSHDDDLDEEDYDDHDMDDDDGDEVSGDEDGDNQVVPWSSTSPPPAASSSSSEESVSISETISVSSLKRLRDNASDLHFQAAPSPADGEATSVESTRPLKDRKTGLDEHVRTCMGLGSPATNRSLQKFEGQEVRNLGEEPEAEAV
ncbi:Zinc finger, B-box [Quillaja saponaria]|uniref:Zinc finger, B-box n=1 Tax=Quillaja saponaria TaxID=32244 RepID=A0AAD7PAZ8_QUISA|nr:Zinc finger, B-box [Quillaja saponaria]